jgi:hypothetical protein
LPRVGKPILGLPLPLVLCYILMDKLSLGLRKRCLKVPSQTLFVHIEVGTSIHIKNAETMCEYGGFSDEFPFFLVLVLMMTIPYFFN